MLSRMNWLFIILAAGLGYFYRVFQPTYDSDEIIDRTVKPPPLTHDSEAKANKKFTSGLYESSKVGTEASRTTTRCPASFTKRTTFVISWLKKPRKGFTF